MKNELSKIKTLEERILTLEKECKQWRNYYEQIEKKLKQLSDKQKNIQTLYDYMTHVSEEIQKKDKLNQGSITLNRISSDEKDT
jgi:predicted  nucleic acid-binding Zn-ribbon protein